MGLTQRALPQDEYAVFKTLRAKGVAVAPFTTTMGGVAHVGIPAVVVAHNKDAPVVRSMITKYCDIVPAFARAAKAKSFFIQKHVTGHEVVCGVITSGRNILPLVPVEAIPRSIYEVGVWHLRPAVQDKVQALAKAAHSALGVKGHSCVRMVIDGTMTYVISVDVNPPLARTSLFMRSALLAGFTFN